ncbi:TetR/AcrR family transcriptional regulator [Acinetobacter sp. Ac_5812]|uniref:TetR/AcrR family transcriptional regulator n=1 Tax=Acinetobacter sp. Ac_5812 TaxID=1848937 RepID=UPI0014902CC9|nr:TetR/AcrR family transcriptional regulator [Acinetobacter sp. Ac_5812]NNP67430.1 TetR family transcriptional regulator [Acinetobacter sp. Ac_5812]
MTGKRLSKEERRQQLLQVARLIIRTQGVEALTLGYLAEQAGITKPITYRHFIDREGLLISIYQEFDDKQTAELNRSLAAEAKTLQQTIHIFCKAYLSCFISMGPEVGLVIAALSGSDILQNYFQQCQQKFTEIFKQSMRPFIQLDGKEGEAIVIAIMGLIETVSTAASKNQIDALTAQQVMENSLLVILQDYSAT